MTDRKFDWKPNHDPRSRNFAAVSDKARTAAKDSHAIRTRRWMLRNEVLDQGSQGACVGHGVLNTLSSPRMGIELPDPQTTAFGMYYGSKLIDDMPGESYDGTSVLAGCKLAVQLGLAKSYRWCFGVEDVATAVLYTSPVVIGINWKSDMMATLPSGLMVANGSDVGGHCVCVYGFARDVDLVGYHGPAFRIRNSWGHEWGLNGDGWLPYDTMGALLAEQGEAAVLERAGEMPFLVAP